MENQTTCESCSLRKKYDNKPKSLLGRFWRWHINFCPGWKKYMNSIPPHEREAIEKKYHLVK